MTTKTADLQWEMQAYGMTKAQLNRIVKEQAFPGTELMFAAGMLSDAQEILSAEWNPDGVDAHHANRARQMINCAKAIMFDVMDPSRRGAMKETA
jgi:hypothetical protein